MAQIISPPFNSLGVATSSRADHTRAQVMKGTSSAKSFLQIRESYQSELYDQTKAQVRSVKELLGIIGHKLVHRYDFEKIIYELTEAIEELREIWSDMMNRQGPEILPKAKDLLARVEDARKTLNSKLQVKAAVAMTKLEENAETASKRYSNADMLKLINQEVDEWTRDNVDIFLQPHRMSAEFVYRNKQNDTAKVKYFQTKNFRSACTLLESYVYGFSQPINVIFSQNSLNPSSKTEGTIKLETIRSSATCIVLWVYYNIFLSVELDASEISNLVNNSFDKLVQSFCSGIEEGSVDQEIKATCPAYSWLQGPITVAEGKNFTFRVTANHENYHQVFCKTTHIIYTGFKKTDEGYEYTFLANKEGKTNVYFCFADKKTFNSISNLQDITITSSTKTLSMIENGPVVR